MDLSFRLRRKAVHLIDKVRDRIENENNSDLASNGEAHFLKSLSKFYKEVMTVVDVGSAAGAYTSYLPQAEVFSYDGRQNFVISDTDDKSIFHVRTNFPELSSVNRLAYLDSKYGPVEIMHVPTRCLRSLIIEKGIQHIHLLKIDTEGYEMHVLRGLGEYLRPDFIDFIQFERGNAEADAKLKTFYELFESRGFSIHKVYRRSIKKVPYSSHNENLNYANYVAVSEHVTFPHGL